MAGVVALIYTTAPWWDEGLLASPAYLFLHHRYLGSDVFVSMSHFEAVQGIQKHLYVWMPLYPIVLAAWMSFTSYGILSMRFMSLFFGLITLFSWYEILWSLTKNYSASVLGTALIATDYYFVIQSGTARYETLTTALGFGAWALYLHWREQHLTRAVLISSTLIAASIYTHPLGLLHGAALLLLAILLDRRRITLRLVAVALLPLLLSTFAWGLYILQAPGDFRSQFANHTAHRTVALASPLYAVATDLYWRYSFNLFKNLTASWMFPVRAFTLLIYLAGVVGALLTPGFRRERAARFLLIVCVFDYIGLALLDTQKSAQYFIHIFIPLLALSGLWIEYMFRTHRPWRIPLALSVALVVASSLAAVAVKARKNTWATGYTPAASFIRAHLGPDDVIIGPAQLTFALGPQAHLKDDPHLGYGFPWGASPKLIVDTSFWDLDFIRREGTPESAFVTERLRQYHRIYQDHGYTVYARPDVAP